MSTGHMKLAGCLHRYKDKGVEAWHWYDGDPSELQPDVYDIRPLYEEEAATPAQRFAKWVEDGPRLAKAAGCHVGIKITPA